MILYKSFPRCNIGRHLIQSSLAVIIFFSLSLSFHLPIYLFSQILDHKLSVMNSIRYSKLLGTENEIPSSPLISSSPPRKMVFYFPSSVWELGTCLGSQRQGQERTGEHSRLLRFFSLLLVAPPQLHFPLFAVAFDTKCDDFRSLRRLNNKSLTYY